MEFLLLIISLWFIISLIRSAFKASANISTGAPSESGWVYVIERDGYLKIGSYGYNKLGLVNELKKYVSSDIIPKDGNVNLVYYYYFDNFSKKENLLSEYLNGMADKYSDYVHSKSPKTKEGVAIIELSRVPERQNWFKYDCHYNKIHDRIISWFNHSKNSNDSKYSKVIAETNQILNEWDNIFVHRLPEL